MGNGGRAGPCLVASAPSKTKTPRIAPRRFVCRADRLLRNGLLEHAVHLLVRSVAAGLSSLGRLQRLICGALGAVGSRTRGLSGAGSSIGSSLGSGCILHSLLGRGTDLIDGRLRDATACSDEREGSKACLNRGGDSFLHDFFPLLLGRMDIDQSDKLVTA